MDVYGDAPGRQEDVGTGFTVYDPWLEDSPYDHVLHELTHATRPLDGSTVDISLVQRVVAEMLESPLSEHVQYRGCFTLCVFVTHYNGGENVLYNGGVEAVGVDAMLANGVVEIVNGMEAVMEEGGIGVALDALRWTRMYREDALPASMNPDLMRKILGFAEPGETASGVEVTVIQEEESGVEASEGGTRYRGSAIGLASEGGTV
ncbi:hypothetical protein T484DRAFT_1869835 [Baffinella frigidus]|nr:hypothetical protein T484DRAFT_1869835 [Cryptophyta sp. CCMP2293]